MLSTHVSDQDLIGQAPAQAGTETGALGGTTKRPVSVFAFSTAPLPTTGSSALVRKTSTGSFKLVATVGPRSMLLITAANFFSEPGIRYKRVPFTRLVYVPRRLVDRNRRPIVVGAAPLFPTPSNDDEETRVAKGWIGAIGRPCGGERGRFESRRVSPPIPRPAFLTTLREHLATGAVRSS